MLTHGGSVRAILVLLDRRRGDTDAVGKKLKGSKNRYSVRLGRDFRVVYTVFKKERVVDIEFVGDRKDAYRWL